MRIISVWMRCFLYLSLVLGVSLISCDNNMKKKSKEGSKDASITEKSSEDESSSEESSSSGDGYSEESYSASLSVSLSSGKASCGKNLFKYNNTCDKNYKADQSCTEKIYKNTSSDDESDTDEDGFYKKVAEYVSQKYTGICYSSNNGYAVSFEFPDQTPPTLHQIIIYQNE